MARIPTSLVERDDRRRLHRSWRGASRDRYRARRRQGLYDARRRRPVADRADRRDRRSPARPREFGAVTGRPRRCGWVRRRGGSLRRTRQRSRCARADEARCARRLARAAGVHGLSMQRRDADRDAGDTAQLAACEPAPQRCPGGQRRRRDDEATTSCRAKRAGMSRASKRSPACRRRLCRQAPGATRRFCARVC